MAARTENRARIIADSWKWWYVKAPVIGIALVVMNLTRRSHHAKVSESGH